MDWATVLAVVDGLGTGCAGWTGRVRVTAMQLNLSTPSYWVATGARAAETGFYAVNALRLHKSDECFDEFLWQFPEVSGLLNPYCIGPEVIK